MAEANELKITIPEGQEIDWQESAKQEKIVFKKKDTKPRSWEEYCKLQKDNLEHGYIINNIDTHIDVVEWKYSEIQNPYVWRNVLPSKELTDSFLTMMQLMSLRQDWIHKWSIDSGMAGDWKPDWKNYNQKKANIIYNDSNFGVVYAGNLVSRPLSFPTEEMAEDFMSCFKDLLENARPLI